MDMSVTLPLAMCFWGVLTLIGLERLSKSMKTVSMDVHAHTEIILQMHALLERRYREHEALRDELLKLIAEYKSQTQ